MHRARAYLRHLKIQDHLAVVNALPLVSLVLRKLQEKSDSREVDTTPPKLSFTKEVLDRLVTRSGCLKGMFSNVEQGEEEREGMYHRRNVPHDARPQQLVVVMKSSDLANYLLNGSFEGGGEEETLFTDQRCTAGTYLSPLLRHGFQALVEALEVLSREQLRKSLLQRVLLHQRRRAILSNVRHVDTGSDLTTGEQWKRIARAPASLPATLAASAHGCLVFKDHFCRGGIPSQNTGGFRDLPVREAVVHGFFVHRAQCLQVALCRTFLDDLGHSRLVVGFCLD